MADEVTLLLKFETDRSGLSKVESSTKQLKTTVASVTAETNRLEAAAKSSGTVLARNTDAARQEFEQLRAEINRTANELDGLNTKKVDVDVAGAQGDISTSLSSVASLAGNFGVDTGALQIGSDLTGVLEYAGKFKEAIAQTGNVMKEMPGILGGVASGAAATVAPLGATAAGLAAILAPTALVAVAVAPAAIAIKLLSDRAAELEKSAQQVADALGRQSNIYAEAQIAIMQNNPERALQLLSEAEQKRVEGALRIQFLQQQMVGADEETAKKLQEQIDTIVNTDLNDAYAAIDILTTLLPQVGVSEQELADARQAGWSGTKEVVKAEEELNTQREQAFRTVANLREQQARLETQAATQSLQTTQDRELKTEREEEDFAASQVEKLAAHHERLDQMESAGQERLASIRQQGIDKIASIDAQIGKLNQSIATVNTEFMASERKRVEKLAADLKRMDAQVHKERIRRLEGLNDELMGAEQANDVNRFIEAQRSGNKDLSRMSEDADEQARLRIEQAAEEARLAEDARAKRIADIEVQITEQQRIRQETISSIKAQLVEEKNRIDQQEAAAKTAFEKQQAADIAARDLRLKRQQEEEQIADARRATALQTQLADIDKKVAAEKAGAGIVETAWTAAAKRIAAATALTSSSASTASLLSNKSLPGKAFAGGGITTSPTLGLLGERPGWGDITIPFRQSEGIDAALARHGAGGTSLSFSFGDVNLGGISKAEFDAGMDYLAGQVVQGIGMARTGANPS